VTGKEVDRWLRGLLHHQSDPSRMTRLEVWCWQADRLTALPIRFLPAVERTRREGKTEGGEADKETLEIRKDSLGCKRHHAPL
jgi:hypothetical protein